MVVAGDKPGATRRRGPALEAALLDAAWEELLAVGYEKLTMDAVAAKAGTSRAVLYRRWPNLPELVLAAMHHRVPPMLSDPPDTGDLREDVLALLRRASQRYEEFSEGIRVLLMQHFRDPEFSDYLRTRGFGTTGDTMAIILKRAADRGEIDLGQVTPRVASIPIVFVRHEFLTTHRPVPETTLVEIVDEVFLPLLRRPGRSVVS